MKSILEEFANGNITTQPPRFNRDSHYGRTVDILAETEEKLLFMLDGELKETFKQFLEARSELSCLSDAERFIYGYRLGVLMTMEVFNGRDSLIVGGEQAED